MTATSFIWPLVTATSVAIQAVAWLGLLYHYLLLAASTLKTKSQPTVCADRSRSFAIAIPAHNEETVLAETVRLLAQLDYPRTQYDVFVVADYCVDQTADTARAAGATCYERQEGSQGRKAHALRWLLDRILDSPRGYDAVVVFDADSHVEPGFLTAMNQALASGRAVLQGRRVMRTSGQGGFESIEAADMRINNLLRNQAKARLGLSCRLMGDAMCFTSAILRQYGWPTESLVEDREYGLYLGIQGVTVGYVPAAVSYGQTAPSWRAASQQRVRWYAGVHAIRRSLRANLLEAAISKHQWSSVDGAVEMILPPFSVLGLLSAVGLGLALIRVPPHHTSVMLSCGALLLWVALPFLCLTVDRAPATEFGALAMAPAYLLWRLLIGLAARLGGKRVRWVRTVRREETKRLH